MKSEVVIFDGIPFSEGPVWCPDATLVVTTLFDSQEFPVPTASVYEFRSSCT